MKTRTLQFRIKTSSDHNLHEVLCKALHEGDLDAVAEAREYLVDIEEVDSPDLDFLPYYGLFHTPASFAEMQEQIERYTGQERVIAWTIFGMTMNFIHAKVHGTDR